MLEQSESVDTLSVCKTGEMREMKMKSILNVVMVGMFLVGSLVVNVFAEEKEDKTVSENIVFNGSFDEFETDAVGCVPKGWRQQGKVDKVENHMCIDDKEVFKGKHSMKITGIYGVGGNLKENPEVGKTYEIAAWIKAEKDNTLVRLGFNGVAVGKSGEGIKVHGVKIGERDGKTLHHYYSLPETYVGTRWQYVTADFTLRDDCYEKIDSLIIRLDTFEKTIWVDEVKMVEIKEKK